MGLSDPCELLPSVPEREAQTAILTGLFLSRQGDLMFLYPVEQELRATSAKEGQRKTARSVPAMT